MLAFFVLEGIMTTAEIITAALLILNTGMIFFMWLFDGRTKRFDKIDAKFDKIDARFEAIQKDTRDGFVRVDDRFEAMQKDMRDGFVRVDGKIETLQKSMDSKFDIIQRDMKDGFSHVEDVLFELGKEVAFIRGAKEEADRRGPIELPHIEYEEKEHPRYSSIYHSLSRRGKPYVRK